MPAPVPIAVVKIRIASMQASPARSTSRGGTAFRIDREIPGAAFRRRVD
jgi:hypothetical protein